MFAKWSGGALLTKHVMLKGDALHVQEYLLPDQDASELGERHIFAERPMTRGAIASS